MAELRKNEHEAKVGLIYCKWTVKDEPKDGPILCTKKTNDLINRAYSEGLNLMDDSLINASL